jgi:hypothetical protein
MSTGRRLPDNPVEFIQRCLRERKLHWTYHVNMRLAGRYISRAEVLAAVETYSIVEAYPDDKYLPSYLLLASTGNPFHALFAADVEGDNIRIVTAYRPNLDEWEPDLRTRRPKP